MAQQQASTVDEYPAARLPSAAEYCRIAVRVAWYDRQMVALSHRSNDKQLLNGHK
jgi:hypothetical protein